MRRVPCVVGVDIGTQSTKALVVDATGRVLGTGAAAYQVDTPQPGWAQQSADVWLEASVASIREAVARAGAAADVQALGISSLGGGAGVPVDGSGTPLHPCLIWMDRRAQREAAFVEQHLDARRLRAISGNGIDSFYGFTKMLWLRDHEPAVWARTRHLLSPNSYVNLRLTGTLAMDHSSAGNIGAVYDIGRRAWSTEALDMLGIPAHLMPQRLLPSSEVIGALQPHWAARLGLPAGLPVVAGGVDASAATLAAGATRPGQHVAMLGTSMCWGTIRQRVDADHGLVSFPHVFNPLQDLYVFGGAMTAGGAISWFREAFCQDEARAAREQSADVHALLEAQAAAVPPGSDGVLFLPYLMGERSPVWDAQASGSFIGLRLTHGKGELYRSVLEGIAFALRQTIDAGALGAEALDERLLVVGGLTRSDLCMQLIADTCGRPVATMGPEVEAPLGAAMLAALGIGMLDEAGARAGWATARVRAEPLAANVGRYAELYRQYRAAYRALRPVMHRLRELGCAGRTAPAAGA